MVFDIAKNTFHSCDIYLPKCWVHLNSNSRVTSISYFKKRENWRSPSSWNWSQLSIRADKCHSCLSGRSNFNLELTTIAGPFFCLKINEQSAVPFWFSWRFEQSQESIQVFFLLKVVSNGILVHNILSEKQTSAKYLKKSRNDSWSWTIPQLSASLTKILVKKALSE